MIWYGGLVSRMLRYFVFCAVVAAVMVAGLLTAEAAGPVLGNFLPADGSTITQSSPYWLKVSLTADDPDKVISSSIQMRFNSTNVSSSQLKVTYAEVGHYEETYDTCTGETMVVWVVDGYNETQALIEGQFYIDPGTLPDGNRIYVSVADGLGEVSSVQWTLVRNNPPVVSSLTPTDGSTIINGLPVISAVVTDIGGVNVSSIKMMIDSVVVNHTFDSGSSTVSFTPEVALGMGDHKISLIVSDNAGNTTTVTWGFYVPDVSADTGGPVLSNFSPPDGSGIMQTSAFWLKISFAAEDPSQVDGASVQMRFNGKDVHSTKLRVMYKEVGHYEETYDTCTGETMVVWVVDGYDETQAVIEGQFYLDPHTLPDTNQVYVSVTDRLGKISSSEWTLVRNNPPVVSSLTPTDGSTVTNGLPVISAVVTDLGGINASSLKLMLNGAIVGHTFNSSSGTISYTPEVALDSGTYEISLSVSDNAGNITIVNWSFYVPVVSTDTEGPALSNFSPLDGSAITQTSAFWLKVSFKAKDPSQVDGASIQMSFNSINVQSSQLRVTYPEVGHYEESYDTCTGEMITIWVVDGYDYTQAFIEGQFWVDPSNIPDTNQIFISVADKLGFASEARWELTYDKPPTVSQLTPANGSTISTGLPVISAVVADKGGIDASSIILTLNGTAVSHTYNSTNGTVSYTPAVALVSGPHDVTLSVSDSGGNIVNVAWYFVVPGAAAEFVNPLPAPGATVEIGNPTLQVFVVDTEKLDGKTLVVSANGTKIPAVFTYLSIGGHYEDYFDTCTGETIQIWVDDYDYTQGTITCSPPALPDGLNTVAVSIANVYGNTSTTNWSFSVMAPPVISSPSPANVTVTNQTPMISAKVAENGNVAEVKMLVDGLEVPAQYDAVKKTVSSKTPYPLSDESDHQVTLTVTDGAGLSVSISWMFHIQVLADMPVTTDSCATCHTGYPYPNHPMGNCDGCHGGNTPIDDCRECHGNYTHGSSFISGYSCNYCHNDAYTYKIPMHQDIATLHSSTTAVSCSPCHSQSLTREHVKYSDVSGISLNCATCHSSTNDSVKTAISTKTKACEACHVIGSSGHTEMHVVSYGAKCVGCHGDDMMNEKIYHKGNCSGCHQNTLPRVKSAVDLQNRTCFGCHDKPHGVKMAVVRDDIPLYGTVTWSKPDPAAVWSGEGWLPDVLNNDMALVLFSHQANLNRDLVYSFYKAELINAGWVQVSENVEEGGVFSLLYKKGRRHILIWFFSGMTPTSGGGQGYRILLVYN